MSKQITPNGSWILVQKEMKLLFKTKRRVFLLTMMPLIIIIFGFIAGFANQSIDNDTPLFATISVIDENPSQLTVELIQQWNSINNTEIQLIDANYTQILENLNFQVLVYIPSNFTSSVLNETVSELDIIYNTNSSFYQEVATDVFVLTSLFERNLILSNNPDVVFDIIDIRVTEVETEKNGRSVDDELIGLLVVLPIYLMIFIIITPMSLILISVTIEREQRTLETLFLQPVRRKDIVLGKVYYGLGLVILTLVLDILATIIAITSYMLISGNKLVQFKEITTFIYQEVGGVIVIAFLIGVIAMAFNIIALAVLMSLLAKDEREANMISGLLPLLIFGMMGIILVIPVENSSLVAQLILVILPVVGIIFAIFISGISGSVGWLAILSLISQIIWGYLIIEVITKVSEVESILELNYGKVFRELRKLIFRR